MQGTERYLNDKCKTLWRLQGNNFLLRCLFIRSLTGPTRQGHESTPSQPQMKQHISQEGIASGKARSFGFGFKAFMIASFHMPERIRRRLQWWIGSGRGCLRFPLLWIECQEWHQVCTACFVVPAGGQLFNGLIRMRPVTASYSVQLYDQTSPNRLK